MAAILILGGASFAKAAEISLSSMISEINPNQEFLVDVILNTEEADVNAVQGKILFPQEFFDLEEIRDGDSIIPLWLDRPRLLEQNPLGSSMREVMFSGIIPGGFRGVLSPFYEGYRPGKLLSLVFKAKALGQETILANNMVVLLNDGRGSPARVSVNNLAIKISDNAAPATVPVISDVTMPEAFIPEVTRNDSMLDGKWFLVFGTADKESGIDHYEVAENRDEASSNYDNLAWEKAVSPHILSDQALKSFIYVRAVDKSGNSRIQKIAPRYPQEPAQTYWLWGILILVIALIIYGRTKYRGKKP